jgi:hypothetical protein
VIVLCLVLWLGTGIISLAQIQRVGAGLEFATGFEFNSISIGNPGFKAKTWVTLDPKRQNLHLVPTVSVFNRNRMNGGLFYVTNYMFMGDLDGQYTVYRDRTLQMVVFAGVNFTHINSVVEQADPLYPIPEYAPIDTSGYGIGGNIGGALELRMADQWDMNVSVKYIVSKYSQFIISVEGVYYFKARRKRRR